MAQSHQVILTITARKDINNILDYLLEKVSYSEAADARQKIIAARGTYACAGNIKTE